MYTKTALLLTLATLGMGCEYNFRPDTPTSPSYVVTNPTPTPARADIVEFRVTGDLPFATVRVNNSLDGLSQTLSTLPFTQTLDVSGRDVVFLSLDARGNGSGFLHAAIFVNGFVFRETSSQSLFTNPFITVSGTWRR